MLNQKLKIQLAKEHTDILMIKVKINGMQFDSQLSNNPYININVIDTIDKQYNLEVSVVYYNELFYRCILQDDYVFQIVEEVELNLSTQFLHQEQQNYLKIQTSVQNDNKNQVQGIYQVKDYDNEKIVLNYQNMRKKLKQLKNKLVFKNKSHEIFAKYILLQARKKLKKYKQKIDYTITQMFQQDKQGIEFYNTYQIKKGRKQLLEQYQKKIYKSISFNKQCQEILESGEVLIKSNDQHHSLIHLFNPKQKSIYLINKLNSAYPFNTNTKDEPFYFDQNNAITIKSVGSNKNQLSMTNIDTNLQQTNSIDVQPDDRNMIFQGYTITFCKYKLQNYLIKYKQIYMDIPKVKKTSLSTNYILKKKIFITDDCVYFLMQLKDVKEKIFIGKFSIKSFSIKVINEINCDDSSVSFQNVITHFNSYVEFNHNQIISVKTILSKKKSKDICIKFNIKKTQIDIERNVIAANKYFFNVNYKQDIEVVSLYMFKNLKNIKFYKTTNIKNQNFDPSLYSGYKFVAISDGSLFIYCQDKEQSNLAYCFVYTKKYIIQVKSPLIYYQQVQLCSIDNFIYLYAQDKGLIQIFDCLLGDWIKDIHIQQQEGNYKIIAYLKSISLICIESSKIVIQIIDTEDYNIKEFNIKLDKQNEILDFHVFYSHGYFNALIICKKYQKNIIKFNNEQVQNIQQLNLEGNVLIFEYIQSKYYVLIENNLQYDLLVNENLNELKKLDKIDESFEDIRNQEKEYCILISNNKQHLSRILYFRYSRNNSLNQNLSKKLIVTKKDCLFEYDVNFNTLKKLNTNNIRFPCKSQCIFNNGIIYFITGSFNGKYNNSIFTYNIYNKEIHSYQFEELKKISNPKCVLIEKKIMILGGIYDNKQINKKNYFFDIKTNKLHPFANMINQRKNFEIINIQDGFICLFGEDDNNKVLKNAEYFDKYQQKFKIRFNVENSGLTKFNIVKYTISKYLLFGGFNDKNEPNFNFYVLEFQDKKQIKLSQLLATNFNNFKADLCFIYNKRLLIYGKKNIELNVENLNDILLINSSLNFKQKLNYENLIQFEIEKEDVQFEHQNMLFFIPDKNKVLKITQNQIQIVKHDLENINKSSEICFIGNNQFLLAGGLKQDNKSITNEVYLLTYQQGQLQKQIISPMINYRFTFSMIYHDNQVYAMGGRTSDSVLSDCEKYDLKRNKWIKIASFNQARATASTTIYKNKIYVFGGYTGKGRSQIIECYDRIMNQWEIINMLPILPFDGSSLLNISSQEFLLFGGKTDLGLHNKVYYYNFESDIWDIFIELDQKQNLTKCIKFGSKLMLYNNCEKSNFDWLELPYSQLQRSQKFFNAQICSKQIFVNTFFVNF